MAIPALKIELEEPVEERVGKLEVHVEHIRVDVSETKTEIRRLNDKVDGMDQKLSAKIDAVHQLLTSKIDAADQKLSGKIDAVHQLLTGRIDEGKDSLASLALTFEKAFAELKVGRALDRVWWLLMCGTLLGVMARGFKWI
jgi:predicted  nucleic acid-binding Zn-ribbon protein